MDARSEINLLHVHPDLALVIRRTSQVFPFMIVCGLRSELDEREACATHHSETMHSRHVGSPDHPFLACAVDFVCLTNGQLDYCKGHEDTRYGQVWRQIASCAHQFQVPVEWGGDWKTLKDWGHVQLPWKVYP